MARERRPKKSTVVLISSKGEKREFELEHAERLLDMGPIVNGGWAIDPESNYTYSEEYGLRPKSN